MTTDAHGQSREPTSSEKRVRDLEKRAGNLEQRVASAEEKLSKFEEAFDRIDKRLEGMYNRRIDPLSEKVDALWDKHSRNAGFWAGFLFFGGCLWAVLSVAAMAAWQWIINRGG